MKSYFLTATFLVSISTLALAQVRVEIKTDGGSSQSKTATSLWAKGCTARMEVPAGEEFSFMLLEDCGASTIAVSDPNKTAVRLSGMKMSPAASIEDAAPFLSAPPRISVEKLEETPGPSILGRETRYYKFRSVQLPAESVNENIKLVVEEEFWVDSALHEPAIEGFMGKAPVGKEYESVRAAFAKMKGVPLRHRTTVTIEHAGITRSEPSFTQEITSVSTEPFDETLLQVPKGYHLLDVNGQESK